MATDGVTPQTDLLDALRAEGEVDSQGSFTLDRKQARAKLQKFQLADPRRYVLELVQAAVLRGATRIAFEIDADDMHMRFDGRAFTAAELDDLWGSIFADGEGPELRGLRQLALGLNAALGMRPKRVRVVSGQCSLELRPDRDDRLEQLPPPPPGSPTPEIHVHVEQRLKLGLIVDFLRNLTGRLDEEVYLRERCANASISVVLEGSSLTQGLAVPGAVASAKLADQAIEGAIGWFGSVLPAELRIIKDGVWIDSHPLAQVGPGFVAVVDGERLRKDVSLAKIVADDRLAQIIGVVRVERWGVLAQVVDRVARGELPADPWMGQIRREVLEFLTVRQIRKRADAARLAEAISFREARTGGGQQLVSLAQILVAVDAAPTIDGKPTLRHAYITYPQLEPQGHAIPQLSKDHAKALGRLFAATPVRVDDELDDATTRALARKAWRARPMPTTLPEHRRYALRAPLRGEGMRGELGIRLAGLVEPFETGGATWLLLDGCELGKLEFDGGVPGLDVVVEAGFTPNERFDGVVPDRELARVCLQIIADLAWPLAEHAPRLSGNGSQASWRAVVTGWLSLLVDPRARRQFVWERLGIGEADYDHPSLAGILPTPAQVRAGEGPLALALDAGIFQDTDGTRRSLRELIARLEQEGSITELPREVEPLADAVPGAGRPIVWLDDAQRWILAAIVGESKLHSLRDAVEAKRREQAFWAKPERDASARVAALREPLRNVGVDPALWTRELPGGVGMLALAYGAELAGSHSPSRATIDLIHRDRVLVTRELELGIGPLLGFVDARALTIASSWAEVEDDEALAALTEVLRDAAWALVAGLVARYGELFSARRWLTTLLLVRESEGEDLATRLPAWPRLPTLQTLDGAMISLVELDQIVREHGHIEWVGASTLGAGIRNPPILREEPVMIAALRKRVGADKLIDGAPRVRRHAVSTKLESMPKVERAKLATGAVLFAQSIGGGNPPVVGEVGLSRERSEGGLVLELCTLGRRVALVTEPDMPVAIEAILADPELPLTVDGSVDQASRQYAGHVRRCRRAIPNLIVALAKRYASLPVTEQVIARKVLLRYVEAEAIAGPGRRENRENAWLAARELPLLVDVWGHEHSIASVEARAKKRRNRVDVVGRKVELPPGVEAGGRLIVIADEPARACLRQLVELHDLEAEWEVERAVLAELGHAPELQLPDPRRDAWIDRKASVAGGLEAHLWISRTPSASDRVVCARGNREVGRVEALPGVACQGVLRGEGLEHDAQGVKLDGRQRASLAKQACVLLEALAKQVRSGGKLDANEREQALTFLVEVEGALERLDAKAAEGIGKPLAQLREVLDAMIAPALRRAHARARAAREPAKVEPVQVEPVKVEPAKVEPVQVEPVKVEPAKVEPVKVEPVKVESVEPVQPEHVLLTLVRAELEWIRARHRSVIEQLGLDRLMVGPGSKAIVSFDQGIVLHAGHPLIARLLAAIAAGREVDPIDLTFVVAVVVGLMNVRAEAIGASDERAYLDHLAHSLRLGLAQADVGG